MVETACYMALDIATCAIMTGKVYLVSLWARAELGRDIVDTAKTPMYRYIMNDIRRKIQSGELQPQDPLPTQIDLAKLYNTSEITSRRALAELVKEGYIYRVRGKGSFVKGNECEQRADRVIRTVYFVHNAMEIEQLNNRFWTELLEGAKEVCDESGVDFYLWNSGTENSLPDDPFGAYMILTAWSSFGLKELEGWRNEGRPILTVHFYYPHLNIPYVIADNLTGGYLATQHLLSLGHRRTGIILTGKSQLELNQEFSLRLHGYRLALEQHDIPFDPELVAVVDGKRESAEMGYQGFRQLYQVAEPPTAVFATSDYKAIGAMQAGRDMGLKIPGDVSIVGYDDLLLGQYTYPNLTTVNQNTLLIGRRAAQILLHEMKPSASELVKDEIAPKLVVRDSTSELDESR